MLRPAAPADTAAAELHGRQAELSERVRLAAAHPCVTVVGLEGIGKSTVVRAWLGDGPWSDVPSPTAMAW